MPYWKIEVAFGVLYSERTYLRRETLMSVKV